MPAPFDAQHIGLLRVRCKLSGQYDFSVWSDLHCSNAEECIPALLEADNVMALGVNCISPALVAPALQVRLLSLGNL